MKRLLRQQVSIYSSSTLDRYGRKTDSTPVITNCRFEKKKERFENNQMASDLSDAVCYLDGDFTVELETRIDIDNKKYIVVMIEKPVKDIGYVGFTKLLLKNYV